jgi:hypothetical protein
VQFVFDGQKSNPSAVGTRVWVTVKGRKLAGFVNGGNGFASQSMRRVHFGLGDGAAIDQVEVVWPSGLRQTFASVKPDQIYHITEGKAQLMSFKAKAKP